MAVETVDQWRTNSVPQRNISRLYILCMLRLSPFFPHCSPVTEECYSASVSLQIPASFSLSHLLSILGFTLSIPEGRSIDCNRRSMKSPLCYWRKETSFNRTITLFLGFLLITPSLSFSIYTQSPLLYVLCLVRGCSIGRSQRPRLEACLMISGDRY